MESSNPPLVPHAARAHSVEDTEQHTRTSTPLSIASSSTAILPATETAYDRRTTDTRDGLLPAPVLVPSVVTRVSNSSGGGSGARSGAYNGPNNRNRGPRGGGGGGGGRNNGGYNGPRDEHDRRGEWRARSPPSYHQQQQQGSWRERTPPGGYQQQPYHQNYPQHPQQHQQQHSSRQPDSGGRWERSPYAPAHQHDHNGGGAHLSPSDSGNIAESESEYRRRQQGHQQARPDALPSRMFAGALGAATGDGQKRKRMLQQHQQQHQQEDEFAAVAGGAPPRFTVTLSGVPQLQAADLHAAHFGAAPRGSAQHMRSVVRPAALISGMMASVPDEEDHEAAAADADADDENADVDVQLHPDAQAPHARKKHARRSTATAQPGTGVKCRFWPACEFGDSCAFVHPSEPCSYWPACTAGDAWYACCFSVLCVHVVLTLCTHSLFLHPSVPCRYGLSCSRVGCAFNHPSPSMAAAPLAGAGNTPVPCRFGRTCSRPGCTYLHAGAAAPVAARSRVWKATRGKTGKKHA